jgi:hypothetical protein
MEIINVYLGLYTDGFNLFGSFTVYNFLSRMCMRL